MTSLLPNDYCVLPQGLAGLRVFDVCLRTVLRREAFKDALAISKLRKNHVALACSQESAEAPINQVARMVSQK